MEGGLDTRLRRENVSVKVRLGRVLMRVKFMGELDRV